MLIFWLLSKNNTGRLPRRGILPVIIIIKRRNNDNIVYRDLISRIILSAVHESDLSSVYIAV